MPKEKASKKDIQKAIQENQEVLAAELNLHRPNGFPDQRRPSARGSIFLY